VTTQITESLKYASELAKSNMLPAEFQRKTENIIFAMEIARDLNVSPVTAMRGIYVLNGRVGFYVHFMLMMANRSGAFAGPLRYVVEGEGPTLSVTATVALKGPSGPQDVSETYSLAIANAEGLTRNPKYKTNPVQMLKKRCVRALIDNYCPEVMSGLGSDDPDEDYEQQKRDAKNITKQFAHEPQPILLQTKPAVKEPETFDLKNKIHRALISQAFKECQIGHAEQTEHSVGIRQSFETSELTASLESAISIIKKYFEDLREIEAAEFSLGDENVGQ